MLVFLKYTPAKSWRIDYDNIKNTKEFNSLNKILNANDFSVLEKI